jgi:YD repeat-containing protein
MDTKETFVDGLYQERSQYCNGPNVVTEYYSAFGRVIASRSNGGSPTYFMADHLGTTTGVVNAGGGVTAYKYWPFGAPRGGARSHVRGGCDTVAATTDDGGTSMARVRLNHTAEVAESHRWMFERMEANAGQPGGGVLNIFRALSHSPEALRRFMKFGQYFLSEGKLDPKVRELAILRAGWLCRSPYEFSQHVSFGRRAGLSDDQIRALRDPNAAPAGTFSAQELAVLRFAGEMTADAMVSDETFASVRGFLDEEQVVELAMVTGFYNMVSRVLNALQVDVDAPAVKDLAGVGIGF